MQKENIDHNIPPTNEEIKRIAKELFSINSYFSGVKRDGWREGAKYIRDQWRKTLSKNQ